MAFHFRLDRVLEYRRQKEDQAMQALAVARQRQETEKQRLANLNAELFQQQQALSARLADAEQRWLTVCFINALQEDRRVSRIRLELLDAETQRCQADLVERAREKKLLDTLKDRQAQRYAKEENLREQREHDETATIRRGRKADAIL